jgi:hypothetical protein
MPLHLCIVWCAGVLACCSVSRSVDPINSGVITCGKVNGGHAPNVIADSVRIEGGCPSGVCAPGCVPLAPPPLPWPERTSRHRAARLMVACL